LLASFTSLNKEYNDMYICFGHSFLSLSDRLSSDYAVVYSKSRQ
jgi:hypothetical protein